MAREMKAITCCCKRSFTRRTKIRMVLFHTKNSKELNIMNFRYFFSKNVSVVNIPKYNILHRTRLLCGSYKFFLCSSTNLMLLQLSEF